MNEPIRERPITTHKGGDINDRVELLAVGEPGPGGAPEVYWVRVNAGSPVHSFWFARAGVVGLTNEVLLAMVKDRLEAFQAGPYACRENAVALDGIDKALEALKSRTKARIAQGVEGKMEKHEDDPVKAIRKLTVHVMHGKLHVGDVKIDLMDLQSWGTWSREVEPACRALGRDLTPAEWGELEVAAQSSGNGGQSGFVELRQALTKNVSVKK